MVLKLTQIYPVAVAFFKPTTSTVDECLLVFVLAWDDVVYVTNDVTSLHSLIASIIFNSFLSSEERC